MTWKSIVAGVDFSDEGIHAAVVASRLARAAKTTCYFVHAVRDPWTEAALAQMPINLMEQNRILLDSARARLVHLLRGKVSGPEMDRLDVRFGPPGIVVAEAADEHDAGLVVLGSKHHSALGRWVGGSTVHHLVRTMNRPVFVNGPFAHPASIKRVMVAVDLSPGSGPTVDAAVRFAKLFGAKLQVLHVVEPLPMIPELPVGMDLDVERWAKEELERSVWPRVALPGAERLVRSGPAAATIADAVSAWDAEVLVVGSHGRNWIDRILIGSVTERLLNELRTNSMLVIPVPEPAAKTNQLRAKAVAITRAGRS